MKLSLNWLKDYVELPEDLTPEKLAHDLTMMTVEVEGIESLADNFDKMVVGQILEVKDHPRADKLKIVMTDIGRDKPAQIVCGGTNLAPQQKVAVSLPGSMVRWHGEGDLVEIKAAKLRGVESYGMICSSGEIGLEDLLPEPELELIMDISFVDDAPGTPLANALGLDDYIFEIDNKSMTNRPDLWGHYGVARELAAIYDVALKELPKGKLPTEAGIEVRIEAPEDTPRYAAMTIEGLQNGPSPFWLKSRLMSVGQRPIDVLVDFTNYIMMATGQPTHGFDRTQVKDYIEIRRGRAGEQLELLNHDRLDVGPDSLLITDSKGVLALAGVMGGKLDSIYPTTTDLILEVANFHPRLTRHTSQKFNERTEASTRFEKGINTQRVDDALQYAVYLLQVLQPQAKITGLTDNYPKPTEAATVRVDKAFIDTRLGRVVSQAEISHSLEKLGYEVSFQNGRFTVKAPTWRSTGDIEIKDDILEEVARMLGYEAMTFVAPTIEMRAAVRQLDMDLERKLRQYLAHTQAAQEIFTYPWIKDELFSAAGITAEAVELDSPPAPDMKRLRNSLVPGLIGAIDLNHHSFSEFRIFELAQVFRPGDYRPSVAEEILPVMERHLAGAYVGPKPMELFRQVKGMLEDLPRAVAMEELTFKQLEQPGWADSKLWLNILCGETIVGVFGLLSLRAAKAGGIKRIQSVIFELNLEGLIALPSRENSFEPLPEFPLVDVDISPILDEAVSWAQVEQIVGPMVKRIEFVDVFRGKPIPEGKKSLTLRVWFQSKDGTMTMEQVDRRVQAIVGQLKKRLGATVRGME
ncbi:MAG TPA: phenylalanine--tRNA ligase subunit beta [Tissierellia bacterium]|nr:phenylalanine--tRNA ligase subunit beta [Tissierellia bacterium]